jgi:hypothetical protein
MLKHSCYNVTIDYTLSYSGKESYKWELAESRKAECKSCVRQILYCNGQLGAVVARYSTLMDS